MLLSPEKRLIVAADFEPPQTEGAMSWAHARVIELAQDIAGSGVVIKVNAILRACGYPLVRELHNLGLRVFADLKLKDIPATLKNDNRFLWEVRPEILTVDCTAGVRGMAELKNLLADTTVLGVTVLTTFTEKDAKAVYGYDTDEAVLRLAALALEAGLDGLVCSPRELRLLRKEFTRELSDRPEFQLVTPGIRPEWAVIPGDDQLRVASPGDAIRMGASRIVVGRPALYPPENMTRAEAIKSILAEIAGATEE